MLGAVEAGLVRPSSFLQGPQCPVGDRWVTAGLQEVREAGLERPLENLGHSWGCPNNRLPMSTGNLLEGADGGALTQSEASDLSKLVWGSHFLCGKEGF